MAKQTATAKRTPSKLDALLSPKPKATEIPPRPKATALTPTIPGFDQLPPDLQAVLTRAVGHIVKTQKGQPHADTEHAPRPVKPRRLRVDFGVYELNDLEMLEWFARDILGAVEKVLRFAGGQEPHLEPEDLSEIGNLLEWARKCQEHHGIEGETDRLEWRKQQAEWARATLKPETEKEE